MQKEEFKEWLSLHYKKQSSCSQCNKIEESYGDLDTHYGNDSLEELILEFDKCIKHAKKANKNISKLIIGKRKNNAKVHGILNTRRSSLKRYRKFKNEVSSFFPTEDFVKLDNQVTKLLKNKNFLNKMAKDIAGQKIPEKVTNSVNRFKRDPEVKAWILKNAKGVCEGCDEDAPFKKDNGEPYLEVHHVKTLAEGGSDTVENAIALCPNCHRRCHHSIDKDDFKQELYKKISRLYRTMIF